MGAGCGVSWEGAGAFGSNFEAVLAAICMITGEVFPRMIYSKSVHRPRFLLLSELPAYIGVLVIA